MGRDPVTMDKTRPVSDIAIFVSETSLLISLRDSPIEVGDWIDNRKCVTWEINESKAERWWKFQRTSRWHWELLYSGLLWTRSMSGSLSIKTKRFFSFTNYSSFNRLLLLLNLYYQCPSSLSCSVCFIFPTPISFFPLQKT